MPELKKYMKRVMPFVAMIKVEEFSPSIRSCKNGVLDLRAWSKGSINMLLCSH